MGPKEEEEEDAAAAAAKALVAVLVQLGDQLIYEKMQLTRKDVAVAMSL